MADMLYKATKYMNSEDAMIARGANPRKERGRMTFIKTKGGNPPERTSEWMREGPELCPVG